MFQRVPDERNELGGLIVTPLKNQLYMINHKKQHETNPKKLVVQ